jgi:hypothetical protein
MKPLVHPADEPAIRARFAADLNMSAEELEAWLETEESRSVGFVRRGERESVGHKAGRRLVEILNLPPESQTEGDLALMRKASGYIRRHLAQRPAGDISRTRWRYAMMNWGHDPLKDRSG